MPASATRKKTARTAKRKKTARTATRKPSPVRMLARAQIAGALRTMAEPSGTARFRAGKTLCATAEKDPARVYPHLDAVAALLASDSKIVRWNAIHLIGALAAVDAEHKLDAHLDVYLAFLSGGNLISAANAIQGLGRIGQARPDLLERLLPALLAVEGATYETAECRNVALGHVLTVLRELGPDVCRRPEVRAFIQRQRTSPRAAVARRAVQMEAELAGA